MNFVFFGTPEPAVEIFEYLRKSGAIPKLVVTNPDKPQGRKMVITPSPVKLWAVKNNIPFLQPEKLDDTFCYALNAKPYTLFIVVAYGKIIPKKVLDIPEKGTLNVHYSLLPKYRGATPVEFQILNDDKDIGVTIMLLDDKMDHGPIIAQEKLKNLSSADGIENWSLKIPTPNVVSELPWPPTATKLRHECNIIAGKLLVDILPDWLSGKITPKPQEHDQATYTKKITSKDCEIDLKEDAYKNFLKIQALSAWGTYFFVERNGRKTRIVIKEAEFIDGQLKIRRVVPEGKKEMSYDDFLKGNKS